MHNIQTLKRNWFDNEKKNDGLKLKINVRKIKTKLGEKYQEIPPKGLNKNKFCPKTENKQMLKSNKKNERKNSSLEKNRNEKS